MDFWDFPDRLSLFRRMKITKATDAEAKNFYLEQFKLAAELAKDHRWSLTAMRRQYNETMAQLNWYQSQKPYVKVYPKIAQVLSDTKVNIPTQYVNPPFTSFVIRLPKKDNPLTEGPIEIRSILVCCSKSIDDSSKDLDYRTMMLWIDMGELYTDPDDGVKTPVYSYLNLPLKSDQTVADILDWAIDNQEPSSVETNLNVTPSDDLYYSIAALVIATIFMMTGEAAKHPDIMPRFKERWDKAIKKNDQREQKAILKKGREYGYNGVRLGEEIEREFELRLGPSYRDSQSRNHDDVQNPRGSRKWRHFRHLHLNYYWVGPKSNQKLEARLINGSWVREDLPLPPGMVIKDNLLRT